MFTTTSMLSGYDRAPAVATFVDVFAFLKDVGDS